MDSNFKLITLIVHYVLFYRQNYVMVELYFKSMSVLDVIQNNADNLNSLICEFY